MPRSAALLLACWALALTGAVAPATSAAAGDEAAAAGTRATVERLLTDFHDRSSSADTRYFDRGVWVSRDKTVCWACNNGGPATGAATPWLETGRRRAHLKRLSLATIDRAIARWQRDDGAFSGPGQKPDTVAIDSMVFGVEMGTSYLLLHPWLDAGRRERWSRSLGRLRLPRRAQGARVVRQRQREPRLRRAHVHGLAGDRPRRPSPGLRALVRPSRSLRRRRVGRDAGSSSRAARRALTAPAT